MRAYVVLLPLVAASCRSNPPTPPPAVDTAPVEARGQTLFQEIVAGQPAPNAGNLGQVRLVRADPGDPFIRTFTPETQGQALFEAILQDPARSSGNLGRVKLIRADPRDPFIRYFDGSR